MPPGKDAKRRAREGAKQPRPRIRIEAPSPPEPAKPRGHAGRKIAAVIVLAIILGMAYLYVTYGSLPAAVLSGKQLTASGIESVMFKKLNSTGMFNLTYAGSVAINGTDPGVWISYVKYYNNTRATFSFTGMPSVGNVTVVAISLDNGTSGYSCIKQWNSSASSQNPYLCSPANGVTNSRLAAALDRLVNASSLSNVQVKSYGLSSWDLQPCYSMSGTGSIMVNGALVRAQGYLPSNFSFTACVSAQYDVPLTLQGTMHISGGSSINVSIEEQALNFTTTSSEATYLPGQG